MIDASALVREGGPIGVFDSGLGGLTVVREILRQLPGERIVYIGDSVHVPYGGRSCEEIRDFTVGLGRYLTRRFACRALVVACNTATAAGVEALRAVLSDIPIVGMEPGIKPAVLASHTGKVGVLATAGTIANRRFATLVERHAGAAEIFTVPCPDLVASVEAGHFSGPKVRRQVESYVGPLLAQGVDAIVLGCTHYPVLLPLLQETVGAGVVIIDSGPAVARQVARVAGPSELHGGIARVSCLTTGADEAVFGARARSILLGNGYADPAQATLATGRLFWKEGELIDDADSPS